MKRVALRWLNVSAALVLAALLWGCGSNGDSSSSITFPASATVFYMHSLAFRDTTIMAWGYNAFGQVGDDSVTERTQPVSTGLLGMTGMSAGSNHSLAFMNNSTVRAWGYNGYGQLGDTTLDNRIKPVKVSGLSGVIAVAGGGFHSLALNSDNKVWGWGLNGSGQIGQDTSTTPHSTIPVEMTSISGVTKIAAGGHHSVALKSDNTVWTWGDNSDGQLGNNSTTTTNSYTPVPVKKQDNSNLTNIKLIAAGSAFSVAVDNANNIWAWGYNGYGQLGNNSTTKSYYAVQANGITLLSGENIVAISAGADHVLAVTSNGRLFAWGLNRYGQLGDGSTDRLVPTEVTSFTVNTTVTVDGVSPIVALGLHSLARKSDGKLISWGYNANGQLGNGTKSTGANPDAAVVSGY